MPSTNEYDARHHGSHDVTDEEYANVKHFLPDLVSRGNKHFRFLQMYFAFQS